MDVYNNGPHIIHEMESINFKEGDMIIGNINDIRRYFSVHDGAQWTQCFLKSEQLRFSMQE